MTAQTQRAFGRCSNQVSAGTTETLWLTTTKTPAQHTGREN